MSKEDSESSVLWHRLLAVVDLIDGPGLSIEDLRSHLVGIEEGFDGLDPGDDYEAYVAVLFCRSIERLLSKQER